MIHICQLQNVPSLHEVVKESGCGCSCVDIQRMELIVMQKLDFDLVRAAPLEFLQIVSDIFSDRNLVVSVFLLIVSHASYYQSHAAVASWSNGISTFKSSDL